MVPVVLGRRPRAPHISYQRVFKSSVSSPVGSGALRNYVSTRFNTNNNLAIANRSRVSCINTNRSHNGYHRRSRRYVVAFTRVAGGGIWLRKESLKTHFGLPWVRPGTIAVNSHGLKENSILIKRLAACTHPYSTISEI